MFSVQLLEDAIAEPSETFNLTLSATSQDVAVDPASLTTTVTITDNDSKPTIVVHC